MNELNDLLRPVWGAQKWIAEAWNQITDDEKKTIQRRTDDLFKNGLPFELKHDKRVYLSIFSLLAQLEVLAIQIPLKFESQMPTLEFQQRMHVQLLDEIFHGIIFTKIVYLLSDPYSFPPAYNENVEKFCDFIRSETCSKIAIVLLNLIAEGWVEELFKCLKEHNIAPQVLDMILEDEKRHVSEADLYREIGLPSIESVTPKLEHIEDLFLTTLSLRYNMGMSLITALGVQGMHEFLTQLDCKYKHQLKKIHLKPSEKWTSHIEMAGKMLENCEKKWVEAPEVDITSHRKMLMTQWRDPADPTMIGQFNMDVTCLDFFNKKYPSEMLTILMLQTISQMFVSYPEYQLFLKENKLYQRQGTFVGLVVKLPECEDHLGLIFFQDCHLIPVNSLSIKIKQAIAMMSYCYQRVKQLEQDYPHLTLIQDDILNEMSNPFYPPIRPSPIGVSLSNIGASGYVQAKSPLLPNEAVKFTLMTVERRPVWNNLNNAFEARDILPVSVSVDHRVFDGNVPLPKIMDRLFQDTFQRMESLTETRPKTAPNEADMVLWIDRLLNDNLEFGYLTLRALHTMWPDFINIT